ncbi:MAG TPA: PDZ domain-containing protein [Gemmatimonadota bacterium]|jgi:hypothetical protein
MRARTIGTVALALALWGVPRALAQDEKPQCPDPAGELGIGELRCSSGRCVRGWAFQGGRLITTFTTEPSVHALRPPAAGVLEDGDVIVSVDGNLSTTAEASRRLRLLAPGDRVRLRIRRDGVERDVTITAAPTCDFVRHRVLAFDREAGRDLAEALKHLGEDFEMRFEGLDESFKGFDWENLSRDWSTRLLPELENLEFQFDFDTLHLSQLERARPPYELGVELTCGFFCGWRHGEGDAVVWRGQHPPKVARVVEGGPADRAGIREGDVLLLLGGHSFVGEEGGRALGRLQPGQALTLQYLRGGETLATTTITPRAPREPPADS